MVINSEVFRSSNSVQEQEFDSVTSGVGFSITQEDISDSVILTTFHDLQIGSGYLVCGLYCMVQVVVLLNLLH